MNHLKSQLYFFLILLFGLLWLSFLVFRPYFNVLVFAAAFAVVFHPLYDKILERLKNRAGLAAFLTTVIVIAVVIVPLVFFGYLAFQEVKQIYAQAAGNGQIFYLSTVFTALQEKFPNVIPNISENFSQYARQILSFLFNNLGPIFSKVSQGIIGIFLAALAFYYLLKDGPKLKEALIKFSPLSDSYDRDIFDKLRAAVNSVIKGSLLVALAQGILTGVGLAIFAVPSPALWGMVAVVASLIPAIGAGVIILPAAIYLFIASGPIFGLGILLWGALIVGLIDNLLRPKLIERGIHIHPLLILFSVLGGIGFFGVTGFLLGPLILSLLFALLDIYPILIEKHKLDNENSNT
ncbi:MAG: hypothetical protein A2745_00245 [Candidatus Harrisonbacteria bacterium RIFCSPHIGHO2_01_FULL_44_13]|uniref:AI-2E family transporter n=1 Tax=Candidatus Harrisonbacteria bacterium RIFCSPLOWO2_01_FULL_44_18 TaxID=1798407 RepID=A0A1G1ZNC2_9BACT|nr:MAG: hypothetical protein A2745_00245 [Candidatus Harrisonbacteria bacterium RIFCSPHIGHO2_01_FULL_44_13]OGY65919.1 MAG: hypothetical protein A3A16_00850 [Candidatus Harrisonbacteria bacterium RIFCSPLOWO2_01_FULL_44_18]